MKSRLFILAVIVLFAGEVICNEVPAEPAKELLEVENQLKTVLGILGDEVSINMRGGDFEVSYHTRKFMVHSGTGMGGRFKEKASERTGPDFDGFILRITLQDAGTLVQFDTPQTIKEPYWNTYLDITTITGTNKQIYWSLSYWSKTDKEVLSQIKETLWRLDKSPKKVPYKAQQIAENQGEQLTGIFKKNIKQTSPYRLETIGGDSINLRGNILESIEDDTPIWITGQIHTKLYKSPSPQAAMTTHWDIWMEVENFKEISEPFEIPLPD